MENKKDIGRAFKEKLGGLHREPADSLWDAISTDLDKKSKKTFFERFGRYSLNILVVALLALLGIAVYISIGRPNDVKGTGLELHTEQGTDAATNGRNTGAPLHTQTNTGNKSGTETGNNGNGNTAAVGTSSSVDNNDAAHEVKDPVKPVTSGNAKKYVERTQGNTGKGTAADAGKQTADGNNKGNGNSKNVTVSSPSAHITTHLKANNSKGKATVAAMADTTNKNNRTAKEGVAATKNSLSATNRTPPRNEAGGKAGNRQLASGKAVANQPGDAMAQDKSGTNDPVNGTLPAKKGAGTAATKKTVQNAVGSTTPAPEEATKAKTAGNEITAKDIAGKQAGNKQTTSAQTNSKDINNGPAGAMPPAALKVTDTEKTNPTSTTSHEGVTHEELNGPLLSKPKSLTEEEMTDVLDCSVDSLCIRPEKKDYAKELAEERKQKKPKDTTDYRWFVGLNVASAKFEGMPEALAGEPGLKNRYWKSLSNNYVNAYIGHKIGKHISIQAGLAVFALNYYTGVRIKNTYAVTPGSSNTNNGYTETVLALNYRGINYYSNASNAAAAQVLGNAYQIADVHLNYQLQMLEVPVEVKYRIGNNRFGGGITAGAGALLNYKNEIFVSNKLGSYFLGSYNNISTLSVTGKLGIHIYYCPVNALQITVEPGVNYLLTTFSGTMPYSKNLQFGVQYNFNMKPKKK